MKRSRVIKEIQDFLDLMDENYTVPPSNEYISEYILSCLECLGMLPPPIKPKKENYDTPEEFWIASDYHSRLLEDERFNWESEAECPFCKTPCGEKHCAYVGNI